MFSELNAVELESIDGGGLLEELGRAIGNAVGTVVDVVQVGVKEVALGAGQILTTGASMVTGDTSIMDDYDRYYKEHSHIW